MIPDLSHFDNIAIRGGNTSVSLLHVVHLVLSGALRHIYIYFSQSEKLQNEQSQIWNISHSEVICI